MEERLKRHLREMLPLMLIFLILIGFVGISAAHYSRQLKQIPCLETGWQINGETYDIPPERCLPENGQVLRMEREIQDEFRSGEMLILYTVYAQMDVYVDDTLVYRYQKPEAERFVGAAPSKWHVVRMPDECRGKRLRIELVCPYIQYAGIVPVIWYGTYDQAQWLVSMKSVPQFMIGLAILFIGIVFSVVAVFMRYYMDYNTGLYSLSLFIGVMAIFMVSQQTTILMNMNPTISYILIQNISFMLCPVLYTRYLMRTQEGFRRRVALALHLVSFVNIFVVALLHLLGIGEIPQMMSFTRTLCIVIVFYVFVLEVREHRRIFIFAFGIVMGYALIHYYRSGVVSWVVYLCILAYIYSMLYRVVHTFVKAKSEEIRLKAALEISRSELATVQITSHFFYHTLDSIRALIRIDADKAYKMAGDFAKFARYRVDGVEKMEDTVSFSRELRSIRAYADIKQAQLGERFEMLYDLETEDFEILPLTIQPLVENALIHAVQKRKSGGKVWLKCRELDNVYHIEVIDEGPGADTSTESEAERKAPTAIANVNRRLRFHGIAPIRLEKNELGGITAVIDYPKQIQKKILRTGPDEAPAEKG